MRTLVLTCVVLGLLASNASARTWTDATGKAKVDAEFKGLENGQVQLQFASTGKVVKLPLGTLCEEDQQYVKAQVALAEEEAAGAPPDRFTQAIKDDPTNPEVYINRGMARTNRGELEGAVKDFSKAIELDAENAYAHNGRGLALQKQKNLVAAQQDFNAAIKLEPELPSAYRSRGENLYQLALDSSQSVPELDQEIEKWQQFWNHARQGNLRNTPWQPLNATKGDVSRPTVLRQMAKIDLQFAERLERDYGWHGGDHGGHGHGGHGADCACEACSGTACPHCDGSGCPACGGGKPAPGLGVYPPEVMKGEMVTLVANASQLGKGMPVEAKPGVKGKPGDGPKVPVDSVDFYRDVDGDGLFNAEADQFLAADAESNDGFSVEVPTEAFPPGPQSYFAVPRGAPGTGTGATPEELLQAAETLEQAAQTEQGIVQACESGKAQGLPADQSKGLGGDQGKIADDTEGLAEKVAGSCPEAAELLKEAAKPMKAVNNLLKTAQSRPGEACKEDCEKAEGKAKEAADKLAQAASKLREAYEAAKASGSENPGQAPANAAAGAPTSGANEILAAAPIGPRGVGGPGGGDGDGGDDVDVDRDLIVERAVEYIDDHNYDSAVIEYDRLLEDDPDNTLFLRDRADTQLLRGGYDYAVRDYDRLLSLREEPDADLYYNRGCAHLAGGRFEAAISDFTKSISLNETWSLAYNNRGATYARMAQYDKAVEDFTAAIKLEPGNKLAYRNRALAYKKQGELRKAQADYEILVRLEREGAGNGAGE